MADKPWIGARLAFQAEPNKHLNGRAIPMNMGKVLGGGSSINVMRGCGSAITDIQPRAGKRLSVFRSYTFPYLLPCQAPAAGPTQLLRRMPA